MAEDKKPAAKRLGGLNSGPGAGRLGSLRSGDGAGPSSAAGGSGAGAAGGARKMRFMPTNFARPKARPESTSEGAPSTSVSVASKSESAFEDLVKAAKSEATWQRRGGRGAGRFGTGRVMTTFGGGAGDAPGGVAGGGVRRVWGGRGSGGSAPRRLVKAGDRVKTEGGVKAEDGADGALDGIAEEDGEEGTWRELSEEEEQEPEEDPLNYDQYYPVVLPQREKGEPLFREPDDPTKVIPKDLFDMPEHYQPMLDELDFLQDVEQNDGRLMLFQLPAPLPIASQVAGATADGAGPSVAASQPARLKELPSSRIGKLLVFESGKVKLQVGDVLLDVDPGIPPRFRQDLAIVNHTAKQCVMLAPVALRMVCTPNLDTLLEPQQPLPEWPRAGAAAAAAGAGGSEGAPAAAAAAAGRRAVVDDSSSSSSEEEEEEEGEAMDVDGAQAGAAANGAQQQRQQQPPLAQHQQQQQQEQQQGKQRGLPAVAVKKEQEEEEEEEVVSPRRGGGAAGGGGGGLRPARGRGGGGGGSGVRSPRGGLRSPRVGGSRKGRGGGGGAGDEA